MEDSSKDSNEEHLSKSLTINFSGIPIPLRRTFGAIDRLFSVPLETAIEIAKIDANERIASHADEVKKRRKKRVGAEKSPKLSVKMTENIHEWTLMASSVSAEDNNASAILRSLLDIILDDNAMSNDAVRIIKNSNYIDRTYFFNEFGKSKNANHTVKSILQAKNTPIIERLVSSGLIERSVRINYLLITLFISFIPVMLYFFRNFSLIDNQFYLTMIIVFAAIIFSSINNMYKLTPIGHYIISIYNEYISEQSEEHDKDSIKTGINN